MYIYGFIKYRVALSLPAVRSLFRLRTPHSIGRSQIDLMITFAPPRASGAGAARRVNLLIAVIPAQKTRPWAAKWEIPRHVAASGPPRAQFCGSTEPTRAETNACQTASHHARCSASSATSMPTATGSSARRRLRLLRTTRPRLSVSRATSGVHQHLPPHPSVPAICRIVTTPPRRRRKQ